MEINEFKLHLTNINFSTPEQKKKELWNISGILKHRSNQEVRFDLRPLDKNLTKKGFFKTQADKIVYDIKNQWVIIDTQKLHTYLRVNKLKKVRLDQLISELDWNIVLPKI